ncbi:MAG: hypothetical protein JJ975_17570, partial [Bacteroidia bacterium]|nr:hypothetical protein [Bacteroidia bacterium]
MKGSNFEDRIKDLLHEHTETAPDVMNKVFEKRTALYVFRNRLVLHKYKLIAASLGLAALFFLFSQNNNPWNSLTNQGQTTSQTQTTESVQDTEVRTSQNSQNVESPN